MIRKAQNKDCHRIAEIYNYYLGKSTMDLERKDGEYYKNILLNQDPIEELWVVDQKGIIGWGIIKKYSDRLGYRFTGETSVYIDQEFLGRSVGGQLKRHLMKRCEDLGYHHLIARIFSENDVSINYNIKLGYTIVGVQKEAGFVNGQWKDVTILQYIFQD